MSQWHLLQRPRPPRPGLGYRSQHGGALLVHYSTAAAPAPPHSGTRSFSLSPGKQTLKQLNVRLASYLQKVQQLEATNQRLELQIQEELQRWCPAGLKEVEGLMKTASGLQDQINKSVSLQAQLKLQLLGAELTVFDLNSRCEKEREQRGQVEADLADLKLLEDVLKVQKLPELHNLLLEQKQELQELQTQSQLEKQILLHQMSGGVSVKLQTAESSNLIQQLELLRQRNQTEGWTKVSMMTPPTVTFDPAGPSEEDQAQLEGLRRVSTGLTKELKELHTVMSVLDNSGRQQTESLSLQLLVLQQTVDSLHGDLESVLQAAAQKATEHQVLLDVTSQLEAEIQDYSRLLNGLNQQRASNLHLNSKPATLPPCFTTRNSSTERSVSVQGESMRVQEVKAVSTGHFDDRHSKKSTVFSVSSSNQSPFSQKSETKTIVGPPERSGSDSSTISSTVNGEKTVIENKVNVQDTKTRSKEVQVQDLAKEAAIKISRTETTSTIASGNKSRTTSDTLTSREVGTDITVRLSKESRSDSAKTVDTDTGIETKILAKEESTIHTMNTNSNQSLSETISNIDEFRSQVFGSTEGEVSKEENLINGKNSGDQTNNEEVVIEARDTLQCDQSSERSNISCSDPNQLPEEAGTGSNGKITPTCISDGGNVNKSETLTIEATQLKVVHTDLTDQVETVNVKLDTGVDSNSPGSLEKAGNIERTTECIEIIKIIQKDLEAFNEPSDVKVDPPKTESTSVALTGQDEVVNTKESQKSPKMQDSGMDLTQKLISNTPGTQFLPNEDREPLKDEGNEVKVVRDTNDVKTNLDEQRPKMPTSLTDSGVALSLLSTEEALSPKQSDLFTNQVIQSSHPEICLSPVEMEMLPGESDQTFCPVDLEDHVTSPDLLLSPDMFLNQKDLCFSPAEVEGCFSPDVEEEEADDEVCLTEASVHVRPVEKYILSTKEETQTISFNRDSSEKEAKKSITEEIGGSSLELFEVHDLDITDSESRLTSEGTVRSSHGEGKLGGIQRIIADKEEEVGFGGLYRRSKRDSGSSKNKDRESESGDLNVTSSDGSARSQGRFRPGSGEWLIYGTGSKEKTITNKGSEDKPLTNQSGSSRFKSGEWTVYGGSSGRKSSLEGGATVMSGENEKSSPVKSKLGTNQPETGRFGRRGSGEWNVYGGSVDRLSKEQASRKLPTSPPGSGRFGSQGSGERIVYSGSSEHMSRPIGIESSAKSKGVQLATSPPETGRFGRRSSGEFRIYGGSLPRNESEETQPEIYYPLSPPGSVKAGRFGSRGSGEWKVYGAERISKSMDSQDLAGSERGEFTSDAPRLPLSPPGSVVRFWSGGSGEWRVYGSKRLSSAGSSDGEGRVISPQSSYSGQISRVSRASSGGSLCSSGVVRRSSSVGGGSAVRTSSAGKPVYSAATRHRNSSGGAAQPSGGSQRAPSPGGKLGGYQTTTSNERLGMWAGGRISGSSGTGRTNSTGGRVITSSDRPIRSTGSGTGGNKERISVCKKAALSISKAVRERKQESRKKQQKEKQQSTDVSPLVESWLSGTKLTNVKNTEDILKL